MMKENMKGIILCGGNNSRLYPTTKSVSKQLLPIYGKPLCFYPLSVFLISGIKDILLICKEEDLRSFNSLLGDGSDYGIKIEYKVQKNPRGIAEAFLLGESFIGKDDVSLILGDNIFYADRISEYFRAGVENAKNGLATIFGYKVSKSEASQYGIVRLGKRGKILDIEEKPKNPKSNIAVTGLYCYDSSVVEIAKKLKPSARNELEITDINREYLKRDKLEIVMFSRGSAWLDSGTEDGILNASNFVHAIEKRQGLQISNLLEIAFRMKYISRDHLKTAAESMKNSQYGRYLLDVVLTEEENE